MRKKVKGILPIVSSFWGFREPRKRKLCTLLNIRWISENNLVGSRVGVDVLYGKVRKGARIFPGGGRPPLSKQDIQNAMIVASRAGVDVLYQKKSAKKLISSLVMISVITSVEAWKESRESQKTWLMKLDGSCCDCGNAHPSNCGEFDRKGAGNQRSQRRTVFSLRPSSRVKLTSLRQIVVVPIITANADLKDLNKLLIDVNWESMSIDYCVHDDVKKA